MQGFLAMYQLASLYYHKNAILDEKLTENLMRYCVYLGTGTQLLYTWYVPSVRFKASLNKKCLSVHP